MTKLIDTHSHLCDLKFDADRHNVIERAQQAGVIDIVAVADTLQSVYDVIELSSCYENIYPTAGIHCHYAESVTVNDLNQLSGIVSSNSSIVAIGETGIDLYYGKDTLSAQEQLFENQVRLSVEFGLPIVIHCREAEEQILAILRRYPEVKGVLHCFSGNDVFCRQVVDLGLYVSFSGIVTFKNAQQVQSAVLCTPLDKIVVETDCPYLAPQGHRGKRNEPAYLIKTVETLSELLSIPFEEFAQQTTVNAQRLFDLGR